MAAAAKQKYENGWHDSNNRPPRRQRRRDQGKRRDAGQIAQARCTFIADSHGLAAASTISAVICVMQR